MQKITSFPPSNCFLLLSIIWLLCFSSFTSCHIHRQDFRLASLKSYFTSDYNKIYHANTVLSTYVSRDSIIGGTEQKKHNAQFFLTSHDPEAIQQLDSIIMQINTIREADYANRFRNEALFILGKAYYYKKEYYEAYALFELLDEGMDEQSEQKMLSLAWKLRAANSLNDLSSVNVILETLFTGQNQYASSAAFIYTSIARVYQDSGNIELAIYYLQSALKTKPRGEDKRRLKTAIATLQTLQQDSILSLSSVVNTVTEKTESVRSHLSQVASDTSIVPSLPIGYINPNKSFWRAKTEFVKDTTLFIHDKEEEYERLYTAYQQHKYREVLLDIASHKSYYEGTPNAIRVDYLETLALGKTSKASVFAVALLHMLEKYPTDYMITPLIQKQLLFMLLNPLLIELNGIVLTDIPERRSAFAGRPMQTSWPAMEQSQKDTQALLAEDFQNVQTLDLICSAIDIIKDYYFVINVESGVYNLNPSRYRIGQYNRNVYKRAGIIHQFKKISNTNQLIFIGPFQTFVEVSDYERRILPLLEEIMKIPEVKYNTFVIDKDDFALILKPEDLRHYQALSVDMNKEY